MGLQAGGMVVFDGYANHRIYARTLYRMLMLMIFSLSVLLCVLLQECSPPGVPAPMDSDSGLDGQLSLRG